MTPAFTFGYHTFLTLEGVLHMETLRRSPDPEIRNNILIFIKQEYDKKPLDYCSVYYINEKLGLSSIESQRNIHVLDHFGLIDPRKMATGYHEIKINGKGIDELNRPSDLDNKIALMMNSYSNLYRLENILRNYLEASLILHYGEKWWDDGIPQKVREGIIKNKIRDGGIEKNINYTDFNHLKRIIFEEENWSSIFEKVFKSQMGITGRLDELEIVRNRIAHTRLLSNEEIIKLELYLKDISTMINNNK